jgi:CspA family cold shock protein
MSSSTSVLTGQVKWFNSKTGYGFITLIDGEHAGKDIFTHYSSIQVTDSQYKFLVQGEYVELGLMRPETGEHEFQATNVTGIKGGKIMCEMRNAQTRSDGPRSGRDRRRREPRTQTAEDAVESSVQETVTEA